MSSAIAVLNAGSSSVKFSLFAEAGEALLLQVRGQIEGCSPRPDSLPGPPTAPPWPKRTGATATGSATTARSTT